MWRLTAGIVMMLAFVLVGMMIGAVVMGEEDIRLEYVLKAGDYFVCEGAEEAMVISGVLSRYGILTKMELDDGNRWKVEVTEIVGGEVDAAGIT